MQRSGLLEYAAAGWLAVAMILTAGCGGPAAETAVKKAAVPAAPVAVRSDAAVTTVNPGYDRLRSRVMIRRITRPTRANLDYAAYAANVVLVDTAAPEAVKPAVQPEFKNLHFDTVLVPGSMVQTLDETPLRPDERREPFHWRALKEYLMNWDFEKAAPLMEAAARVEEEKWGNDEIYQSLQKLTDLYLHAGPEGVQVWGKVELEPWAGILDAVEDSDGDGFEEFYGRVASSHFGPELLDHLQKVYAGEILDREGIETWANELASFWYPSYNTDIAGDEKQAVWPNDRTDKSVFAGLKGLTVASPAVVIKGKPFNYAVYNVFLVDGMQPGADQGIAEADAGQKAAGTPGGTIDPSVEQHTADLLAQLGEEDKRYGSGGFADGVKMYTPFYDHLKKATAGLPEEVSGVEGTDGFIYFNRSYEYLGGGDLLAQPAGKNPLPVIKAFRDYLAERGIDFLFIPVPVKPAIYNHTGFTAMPADGGPYADPHSRKFLKDLLKAGIEVVDLWPGFIAARDKTAQGEEPLYQKQDTHWTARGLETAAAIIAGRIKSYTWYAGLDKTEYGTRDAAFNRMGDIVTRLDKKVQGNYKPQALTGHQVMTPAGKPYRDSKAASILVLGDSFTAVYQRTDCKHAGLTAHLAKETGVPMRLIMGFGGGPMVIKKLEQKVEQELAGKKLVIWTMVARDLYNYWDDWKIPAFIEAADK